MNGNQLAVYVLIIYYTVSDNRYYTKENEQFQRVLGKWNIDTGEREIIPLINEDGSEFFPEVEGKYDKRNYTETGVNKVSIWHLFYYRGEFWASADIGQYYKIDINTGVIKKFLI